jgi:Peptidase family M48
MISFWLDAATITLSSFAVAAIATSVAVGVAAPALARRAARYAPASRATLLFQLRLLPATFAAVCALGIALPIYLVFEPRDNSEETFARTLIAAAGLGALLLGRAAWRAAEAWRATGAIRRDWQARGRRLHTVESPIPVFAIDESFPTVAVVGFSQPVLFIAERVLRECSTDEVRAMILHECAHITQRDNLKRFLMRACPDVLRRDGTLERAWTSAAEEAADARAVAGDPGFALELAQALIRVARLAPRASTLQLASAFYLGGSIENRVRHLLEPNQSLPDPSRPLGCVIAVTMVGALAALVVLAAPALHELMEVAVRALP